MQKKTIILLLWGKKTSKQPISQLIMCFKGTVGIVLAHPQSSSPIVAILLLTHE